MIPLLVALMGALGRRAAGGGFQDATGINLGDFPTRAFFGLTIALAAWLGGVVWWQALLAALTVFLGCSFPVNVHIPFLGDFGGIHFADSDPLPFWRRAIGLGLHCVVNFAGVIAGAAFLGLDWLGVVLGSLAAIPCYALAWRLTGDAGLAWMPPALRDGRDWGELFWGAAVALSVYLSA